jgi:hypothetical protein
MQPNIYLDIDQVLIANENYAANYASDLIKYVVENFPTYWLTTHVMDGNAQTAIDHIGHLFDEATVELMRQIKGTSWRILKTEAIDMSKPFIWLDDDCLEEERAVLLKHNCLENWREINLFENEDQLLDILNDFPVAAQPLLPPYQGHI